MIPRYETKEMKEIWSLENQYKSWERVELAVCRAWTKDGVIPPEAMRKIEERSAFDVEEVLKIEEDVKHDVIAFVTNMADHVGPEGRYIHLGLTSSDVVDTASSLRLRESLDIVLNQLDVLMEGIMERARQYKYTPSVGRSHGIHAEPLTFGQKILNWYSELLRDQKRLELAREEISCGKISGAVGTYAHCPPHIEAAVCAELGLKPDLVSTQIIQRDRHAMVMFALASVGEAMERIATEIRHFQRTEVLEVMEPFGKKQKGSSAMPHKKNPIQSEKICGMARMLRAFTVVAQENVALWHERDISHSSNERIMWPDAFHLCHYMMKTLDRVVRGMVVSTENLQKNLDLTGGLVYSQRVLLELVERFSLKREDAYLAVQRNAIKTWAGEGKFLDLLAADELISGKIGKEELAELFTNDYYFRFVDDIFARFDNNQNRGN